MRPAGTAGGRSEKLGKGGGARREPLVGGVAGRRGDGRRTGREAEKSSWSPDGKALAFASARNGNFDIYLRKTASGTAVRLTDGPAVERYPAWSPSGDRIAYVSNESGSPQIYLWDLAVWRLVAVTAR